MYKHRIVWLPLKSPAFEANLDELSLQGWDFVAWYGEPCEWDQFRTNMQRQAIIRQSVTEGDRR